jgi:hypothetical protein
MSTSNFTVKLNKMDNLELKEVIASLREFAEILKSLQRDRKEPGRREKERISRMIYRQVHARFARQLEKLRSQVEDAFPGRKAIGIKAKGINYDDLFSDDDAEEEELIAILQLGARGGIELFSKDIPLKMDYTLTNKEAAKWAQEYSYELIKGLNETTRKMIMGAIEAFVKDPDYTMKDLFDLLEPAFGQERAENIAVTEVTRAYAQGQTLAGDALKEEWPDVKVIDRWNTNNDDLVCELCGPLNNAEVEHGEDFYEPEDDLQDGQPPRHVKCRCWKSSSTRIE